MRYRFDGYELDTAARVLRGPQGPVGIQPRAMSLLLRLVENRHRAVSASELLETVWAGEVVTGASIPQAVRSIRRALGDDGDSQRTIRTVRRHGYQFVAPVADDEPPRRLLGRDAELAALRAAAHAASGGSTRLVLVEGEAGIGKTTLVTAFADELRAAGVEVAAGSAHPQGDAPPFWPWIRALRELEAQLPGSPISPTLEAAGGTADDRYRRFDDVRAWLARRAADRAVCLLFEDLHWTDASTLQLLQFVLRESARPRLLFVATWRGWGGADRALEHLRAAPRTRSIRLAGLDREATRALAGDDARVDLDDLLARTGGNPLFIGEWLRHRAEGEDARVPPTLRAVIGTRIGRLPAATRRALEVAAVLADAAEGPLVARIVGRDALAELAATGLVRVEVEDGRVAFSHALVREFLYEELAADERERLHAAVADALDERRAAEPDRWCDAVAFHAWKAGPAAAPERTVARCLAAADVANGRVAHAEAAAHVDRALDAARLVPGFSLDERARLLLRAAEAHHWAGQRDLAHARLRDARRTAIALGDHGLLARSALGLGMVVYTGAVAGTNEDALGALDEALAALPASAHALRGAVHARISMLSQWSGLGEAAVAHLREAEAHAREAGEPSARALVEMADYVVRLGPDHDADRVERADRLVAACVAAGQWDLEIAARMCRIHELLAAGRADAFSTAVHECHQRLRQRRHPLAGQLLEALQIQMRDDAESIEASVASLRARHVESRNPNTLTAEVAHLLVLRRAQGRLREIEPLIVETRRAHPNLAFWVVYPALLALEEGRADVARAHLDALLEEPRLAGRTDLQWTPTAIVVGEIVAGVGDRDQIERAWSWLRGSSGRHGVFGMPVAYVGAVDHALGLLAAARGDTEQAIALLARAERDAARLGAGRAALSSRIARGRLAGLDVAEDRALAARLGFDRLAADPS